MFPFIWMFNIFMSLRRSRFFTTYKNLEYSRMAEIVTQFTYSWSTLPEKKNNYHQEMICLSGTNNRSAVELCTAAVTATLLLYLLHNK